MLDRHCPHRRADLSYGYVEERGLRCNYHGWLFGENGSCLAQPYEDVEDPSGKLRKTIHVKNYPVKELAGLLWVYMGPLPAPELPVWEPFTWKNGFVQISFSEIPCNWFQCQENSIDPVHFEWMHSNWDIRLKGKTGPYSPSHVKVDFDEFEHGFIYRRILEGGSEADSIWQVGRVCLWPNALFTGEHFEWRVPIDDGRTLSVTWAFNPVPLDRQPYKQERIPYWYGPIKEPETGRWITTHVMNQDFVPWVGQGEIADRTQEHLGRSDAGVAMLRKMYDTSAKDGTVLALLNRVALSLSKLDPSKVGLDLKKLEFIGSMSSEIGACYAWAPTNVKSLEEFRSRKVVFADTSIGECMLRMPMPTSAVSMLALANHWAIASASSVMVSA